jgi:hypothetical protein
MALLAVILSWRHTRDRLPDESDRNEEADLADRQGERPQCLVVVVSGRLGVQLVGDTLPERVRSEDGLLDPDATAIADGGGLVSATLHPIEGAEQVARYAIDIAGRVPNLTILECTVNGQPGLVAQQDGVTATVMAFDVAGDRIKHIWAVRNPEKLRPWTAGSRHQP